MSTGLVAFLQLRRTHKFSPSIRSHLHNVLGDFFSQAWLRAFGVTIAALIVSGLCSVGAMRFTFWLTEYRQLLRIINRNLEPDDVDLFDMAMGKEPLPKEIKTAIDNGEITREQADGFIEQDESVITDIERKAESENEAELNEAIDQADKLIGEAVGATESKAEPTDKGTSEDKVTGIKKAMVEKDRADAGLPPI